MCSVTHCSRVASWFLLAGFFAGGLCGAVAADGTGDRYLVRRGVPRAQTAARIGRIPTVHEATDDAARSAQVSELAIVRGLTPAGGLTVELDGHFMTQVGVGDLSNHAVQRGAAQCSVVLESTP